MLRGNDLIGLTFGRWRVISFLGTEEGQSRYHCRCQCGTERSVARSQLVTGRSRSCGCSRRKSQGHRPGVNRHSDLMGQRFGRLTVVMFGLIDPNRAAHWLCVCDCGNYRVVAATSLISGRTRSCGCAPRRYRRKPNPATKHPLYSVWSAMRQRCCNVRNAAFPDYGGRGITVCPEWSCSFWQFAQDMGPRPAGCSLDRIDVNGPYSRANCRWADAKTQRHNQRRWLNRHPEPQSDRDATLSPLTTRGKQNG